MKNNNGLQLGWLALSVALATLAVGSAAEDQPNPPKWPATVRVFSPRDTDIEDVVNAAYAINGGHTPADHGQFSSARYAFLFKPGNYSATVPVGYYTTIAGKGHTFNPSPKPRHTRTHTHTHTHAHAHAQAAL